MTIQIRREIVLFTFRKKYIMKKIETSQARAVVGGGFFKSLFKISTGAGVFGSLDPVTQGVVGAAVGGALTKASVKMLSR